MLKRMRNLYRLLFQQEKWWQCILCKKWERIFKVRGESGGSVLHHCPKMAGPFKQFDEAFGKGTTKAKMRQGTISVTVFADNK